MTFEEIGREQQLIASLDVCCQKCRHFGRTVNHEREPSGQCQKRAPEKYQVLKLRDMSLPGPAKMVLKDPVESPFPGVWPWDHCGEFEAREDTPAAAAPVPPDRPMMAFPLPPPEYRDRAGGV